MSAVNCRSKSFRYEPIVGTERYHVLIDEEVLGSIHHDGIRSLKTCSDLDGTGWYIDEQNYIWYKEVANWGYSHRRLQF